MSPRSEVVDRSAPCTDSCAATCMECDWTTGGAYQNFVNVQKRVRLHVTRTGHRVVLRKSCVTVYRPRTEPS